MAVTLPFPTSLMIVTVLFWQCVPSLRGFFLSIIVEIVQVNLVVLLDIETYLFEKDLQVIRILCYSFSILVNLYSVTRYCEDFISHAPSL